MSSHTVTEDGGSRCVDGKEVVYNLRKFFGDVGFHVVVGFISFCGSIHIKSGSGSKVPRIIGSRNINTPSTSVREHDSNMVFGSCFEEGTLLFGVLVGAGQAREVIEHWWRWTLPGSLWWDEYRKCHITLVCFAPVRNSLNISFLNSFVLNLLEFQLGAFQFKLGNLDDTSKALSAVEGVD